MKFKELLNIKKPEDIKSFEILKEYVDDHLPCADCKINGILIEFMYYDSVGFIHYWKDSTKAFNTLIEAIANFVEMEEDFIRGGGSR